MWASLESRLKDCSPSLPKPLLVLIYDYTKGDFTKVPFKLKELFCAKIFKLFSRFLSLFLGRIDRYFVDYKHGFFVDLPRNLFE